MIFFWLDLQHKFYTKIFGFFKESELILYNFLRILWFFFREAEIKFLDEIIQFYTNFTHKLI